MVATRPYLEPGQRVLASAPNLEMPLWGLTISHPLFVQGNGVGDVTSHWIINRPMAMTMTLEDDTTQEYYPAYFEITLPTMDGQGQQDVQIVLQNVDRVIVDELELANTDPSERIVATIRLFLESDLTAGPQNTPLELSFISVAASSQSVTGTAGRPDVLNRAFPAEVYRIERYPGLDR
jgi:hypothetical protein